MLFTLLSPVLTDPSSFQSYLVRWVRVKEEHTISWSIQPHKKSLNFGIFKHPGQSVQPGLSSEGTDVNEPSGNSNSRNNASQSVVDKLKGMGLIPINWIGKCEADRISQGTYDVPLKEGGNYALVFDNTFSKTTSKTMTLVLLTYPTAMPPQSEHHAHNPATSTTTVTVAPSGTSTSLESTGNTDSRVFSHSDTDRSLGSSTVISKGTNGIQQSAKIDASDSNNVGTGPVPAAAAGVFTGILQKRRRKRHQGWARRYFSLDFKSSTLSYYHDRNSSVLRGAIPLSLAAVAANENSLEISLDSGVEIWHLRASNPQDFSRWKRALEKASKTGEDNYLPSEGPRHTPSIRVPPSPTEERDWGQVKRLASQVAASRDIARQLAKDTDPKYLPSAHTFVSPSDRPSRGRSVSPSTANKINGSEDYFTAGERRPAFWRRKTSNNSQTSPSHVPVTSPQLTVPSSDRPSRNRTRSSVSSHANGADGEEDIHDVLMVLLRDLDQIAQEFSELLSGRNDRIRPKAAVSAHSRKSMESDVSQEFFDADEGGDGSHLLTIRGDSEDEEGSEGEAKQSETVIDDAPSDSDSEEEELDGAGGAGPDGAASSSLFPAKPRSLTPLPLNTAVKRRENVKAPQLMPPSLIGFLRKNVGKDLSQISMPVSANEPLTLLQRAAEIMEYSSLLDKAATATDGKERLIYVTAYAISTLSSNRVRERAIRKPFNPMLGETYELVREDLGFRFVAEKVSHRPVQLAYQADGKDWSITQSPMPTQKFWGKSAEIITEGKMRLSLHATGEHFSWSAPASFLRNIIAGEKYVEPSGELHVSNETTGQRSVSTFKQGGMFSGRSEEITTQTHDSHGNDLGLGLVGTWTNSLQLVKNGSPVKDVTIWTAGPLVPNAPKHYGMTSFAASLNEFTSIEDKKTIPPTDSRLRSDQRALEDGDVDSAEQEKVRLEEGQRERRREYESAGKHWIPRWFEKVDDNATAGDGTEVVWHLKMGKDGYWDERSRGTWSGVTPVL